MLAICLARAAVDAGHRVYFTSAADLAARCHRAAREGRWNTCMRFFAGPRLLVIDELGYLSVPDEAVAALFQVITQRHLKGSIVLTTNLGVASWASRLGDPMVTAAMLDRLLQRAVVLGTDGPSYRLRSHAGELRACRGHGQRGDAGGDPDGLAHRCPADRQPFGHVLFPHRGSAGKAATQDLRPECRGDQLGRSARSLPRHDQPQLDCFAHHIACTHG